MNPAPSGARLAVAYQGVHTGGVQLDTFFIGHDGGLHVAWVVGTGLWNKPAPIGSPNIRPQGRALPPGDALLCHWHSFQMVQGVLTLSDSRVSSPFSLSGMMARYMWRRQPV
jgi:hypothetical protein